MTYIWGSFPLAKEVRKWGFLLPTQEEALRIAQCSSTLLREGGEKVLLSSIEKVGKLWGDFWVRKARTCHLKKKQKTSVLTSFCLRTTYLYSRNTHFLHVKINSCSYHTATLAYRQVWPCCMNRDLSSLAEMSRLNRGLCPQAERGKCGILVQHAKGVMQEQKVFLSKFEV